MSLSPVSPGPVPPVAPPPPAPPAAPSGLSALAWRTAGYVSSFFSSPLQAAPTIVKEDDGGTADEPLPHMAAEAAESDLEGDVTDGESSRSDSDAVMPEFEFNMSSFFGGVRRVLGQTRAGQAAVSAATAVAESRAGQAVAAGAGYVADSRVGRAVASAADSVKAKGAGGLIAQTAGNLVSGANDLLQETTGIVVAFYHLGDALNYNPITPKTQNRHFAVVRELGGLKASTEAKLGIDPSAQALERSAPKPLSPDDPIMAERFKEQEKAIIGRISSYMTRLATLGAVDKVIGRRGYSLEEFKTFLRTGKSPYKAYLATLPWWRKVIAFIILYLFIHPATKLIFEGSKKRTGAVENIVRKLVALSRDPYEWKKCVNSLFQVVGDTIVQCAQVNRKYLELHKDELREDLRPEIPVKTEESAEVTKTEKDTAPPKTGDDDPVTTDDVESPIADASQSTAAKVDDTAGELFRVYQKQQLQRQAVAAGYNQAKIERALNEWIITTADIHSGIPIIGPIVDSIVKKAFRQTLRQPEFSLVSRLLAMTSSEQSDQNTLTHELAGLIIKLLATAETDLIESTKREADPNKDLINVDKARTFQASEREIQQDLVEAFADFPHARARSIEDVAAENRLHARKRDKETFAPESYVEGTEFLDAETGVAVCDHPLWENLHKPVVNLVGDGADLLLGLWDRQVQRETIKLDILGIVEKLVSEPLPRVEAEVFEARQRQVKDTAKRIPSEALEHELGPVRTKELKERPKKYAEQIVKTFGAAMSDMVSETAAALTELQGADPSKVDELEKAVKSTRTGLRNGVTILMARMSQIHSDAPKTQPFNDKFRAHLCDKTEVIALELKKSTSALDSLEASLPLIREAHHLQDLLNPLIAHANDDLSDYLISGQNEAHLNPLLDRILVFTDSHSVGVSVTIQDARRAIVDLKSAQNELRKSQIQIESLERLKTLAGIKEKNKHQQNEWRALLSRFDFGAIEQAELGSNLEAALITARMALQARTQEIKEFRAKFLESLQILSEAVKGLETVECDKVKKATTSIQKAFENAKKTANEIRAPKLIAPSVENLPLLNGLAPRIGRPYELHPEGLTSDAYKLAKRKIDEAIEFLGVPHALAHGVRLLVTRLLLKPE